MTGHEALRMLADAERALDTLTREEVFGWYTQRAIEDARRAVGAAHSAARVRHGHAPALHENDKIEYLGGRDPRDGGR